MDSQRNREERRKKGRELVLKFGGPVFVPTGEWSELWRFSSWGSSDGRPSKVGVSAYNHQSRQQVFVDTSLINEYWSPSGLAGRLLAESVPQDVQFPFSVTVHERPISIRLTSGAKVELQMFYITEDNWIAAGVVGSRHIEIRTRLLSAQEIILERIENLQSMPESRWE